jgi:hypothetical protein
MDYFCVIIAKAALEQPPRFRLAELRLEPALSPPQVDGGLKSQRLFRELKRNLEISLPMLEMLCQS